jgi:hypothetical protein
MALPRFVGNMVPQSAELRAIQSEDDRGQLRRVHGQVLDLVHRASALEMLAGRLNPRSIGSTGSEGDVLEELAHWAGAPSEVSAVVADVYGAMLGAGVGSDAPKRTRDLATWTTREFDSATRGEISHVISAPDLEQLSVADSWEPLMAALRTWADSPDARAADRAELETVMGGLGLTADQSSLPGVSRYEEAIADDPEQDRVLVRSFVVSVCSALEDTWTRFRSSLPDVPALSEEQLRELRELEQELRTSARAYLGFCRSLLETASKSPGGHDSAAGNREAVTNRMAEAEDLITDFDRRIEGGGTLRAGMSLAAAALPIVPGWESAEQYRLACERLADGLRDVTLQLCQGLSHWAAGASASLRACGNDFRQHLRDAIDLVEHERAERWEQILSAARALQREVVRGLLDPPDEDDSGMPVRASIAVGLIDEVATTNVDAMIHELIPPSKDAGDASDVADQLMAIEALERRYQTASAVLAGADGILLGAMAADSLGGFSQPILGLSRISGDLHAASSDLLAYVHSPDFAHQLHLAGAEFVNHAVGDFVPSMSDLALHTDSLAHLLSSLHESVGNVGGAFLVELARSDGHLGLAAGKYLLHDLTHVAGQFASHALHQPSIEEALRHAEHASQLVGLELLHGVVAHVPIATGILATVREMRIRREHEISLQSTIGNIALDTLAVGGGVAAAVAATAPIHIGPHALVSIPAAALAAIFVRKQLANYRIHKLEKMQEEVATAYADFTSARAGIVTDFSSSLTGEMTRARAGFLGRVPAHPASMLNQNEMVEHLAVTLRCATTAYLGRLQTLVGEVQRAPSGPGTEAVDLPSIDALIGKVHQATAQSESLLGEHDGVGAMLVLSTTPLPEYRGWAPSSMYRQAYADVARKLTELGDAHRADVEKWIDHSLRIFSGAKQSLDQWLTDANTSLKTQWATALAPFEAAENTFKAELARLGAH